MTFKRANLGLFLAVGADDADSGQIFLHACGERGQQRLDFFVALMDHLAEIPHGEGHRRDGQADKDRQRTREPHHNGNRGNHGDDGGAAVHDSRAQNHAHIVQVVGAAAHQLASAVAHVEGRLQLEQAVEQVATQVEFNIARNADQNVAGEKREDSLQCNDTQQHQHVKKQRLAAQRSVKSFQEVAQRAGKRDEAVEHRARAGKRIDDGPHSQRKQRAHHPAQHQCKQAHPHPGAVAQQVRHELLQITPGGLARRRNCGVYGCRRGLCGCAHRSRDFAISSVELSPWNWRPPRSSDW